MPLPNCFLFRAFSDSPDTGNRHDAMTFISNQNGDSTEFPDVLFTFAHSTLFIFPQNTELTPDVVSAHKPEVAWTSELGVSSATC